MGKVTSTYSGFYGDGMSKEDAERWAKATNTLNARLGIRDRDVTVKTNSNGKYYVEESFSDKK